MREIGESELEINKDNLEFSEIRSGLSGIDTDSYLAHRKGKQKRVMISSALVILVAGFIVVSPLSNAPTTQSAWSAEPQSISASDKDAAEKRCLSAVETSGTLTSSTVLDYRSGIGFLRLDISGEYWNCGFSTSNDSVSLTKWETGISSPGKMVKTSGDIQPDFTLNISADSFDTGVTEFPVANFITGTTPDGVSSVKVTVAGLPEGTATVSEGIYGIWLPSALAAEVKMVDADGKVIETLKVLSDK